MVEQLATILVPIALGCVLPIVIVWLIIRKEMNETNQRTLIVQAAIEKNPDLDIQALMQTSTPKRKLLKEKLLAKLLWGCLSTLLGIGGIGIDVYFTVYTNSVTPCGVGGTALLAVGIAYLINFFVGRRMLAGEIEAEEQLLRAQADNAGRGSEHRQAGAKSRTGADEDESK